MKTITLNQVGFFFSGHAVLNLWGGGHGTIAMDAWEAPTDDRKQIALGVNDGRFGCQSIKSAQVFVYELYEGGYKKYVRSIRFQSEELKGAKKGI